MPIHVLPERIAAQIAAGEVVERPSSVVKELVENAIDAGADDIQVEAREGGKKLIRVVDNGSGVPSDEVEVAFQRHSTSKLSSVDDLDHIRTLGFRGEALASIAAVSRVTFVTRAADEPLGIRVRVEGGKLVSKQESGRPPGTTVTVEDLFYNVPARRKFLRTDRTERRHIDAWLTRYAMAYPHVRFSLSHDGRNVFQSPGSGTLRDVLVAVYGVDIGAQMLQIDELSQPTDTDIHVSGFASPPSLHRANRTYITLFLNGRWISDSSLTYAVIQAYHTLLPKGRYPLAVVMIEMPPEEVDVNVHPAKSEVRFRNGDAVFRAVQRAVRRTLLDRAPVPAASPGPTEWPSSSSTWSHERRQRLTQLQTRSEKQQLRFEEEAGAEAEKEGTEKIPPLRVIGQLGTTYVIAEGPQGMYLIDQHAAHERVLFEQLLADRQEADVASQQLLSPETIELAPESADVLEEHLEIINDLGFEIEPFGRSTMLVRAIPAIVAEDNVQQVLEDVAAALLAGDRPLGDRVEEAVAREVCKRGAIKAGQTMDRSEMEQLIRSLEQCTSPRTCPHGRPTMIHLSVNRLAQEFGRTG